MEGNTTLVTKSPDGNLAYVINDTEGLVIVDVNNSTNPTFVGSYNILGAVSDIKVSHDGAKVFIVNSGKIIILDVTEPANPMLITSFTNSTNTYPFSNKKKVYLLGWGLNGNEIKVLDISDLNKPTLIGPSLSGISRFSSNIVLNANDTLLYLNGFTIFDVTDSQNIKPIKSYESTGYAKSLAVSDDGTKVYVTDTIYGLVVVDTTIDTTYLPKNFGTSNIELNIYSNAATDLDISITTDRNDIITKYDRSNSCYN